MPLTDDELRRRIDGGEDELTEFKANVPNGAELRQTLVAFANSVPAGQVGTCFIGVNDDGEAVGVDDTDGRQRTIRRIAQNDCYPPIDVSCRTLDVDGNGVLAVEVPHSTTRPHFAGAAYVRRGSESVAASREQYEQLIASRHDKCRVISAWGNAPITVEMVGKRLGDQRRLEGNYRASCDAQILECTPHHVRLVQLNTGDHYVEPIENVVPLVDVGRNNRPKLLVRLP